MKHAVILWVLVFGSLWGVSEVFLGEALYGARVRMASVPLNLIGLGVLTFAWASFPRPGVSVAIACCAGLYKLAAIAFHVAGTPFFLCHLLGILALGAGCEVVFAILPTAARTKARRVSSAAVAGGAAAAIYLAYASFALAITFAFRYEHWVAAGWPRIVRYVGIDGTLAALGAVIVAPLARRFAEHVGRKTAQIAARHPKLVFGSLYLVTAALLAVGLAMSVRP
jgi:hypothetical protein